MQVLVPKQYCQIAWVVDDLDAAIRQWQQTAQLGPFFTGAHVGAMFSEMIYRGRPSEIDISCAIAQSGGVQIELIKQHGSAPSPYREVFAEGQSGLHHICSMVDDVDAECRNYQDNGFEVIMTGLVGGGTPVAYVDTRPFLGCMTELMGRQGLPALMFQAAADAAANWDGSDPIRDLSALMS